MSKKQKKQYKVFVQFDAKDIKVTANNKREALQKVKAKLKDISAYKFLDKQNIYVDEVY